MPSLALFPGFTQLFPSLPLFHTASDGSWMEPENKAICKSRLSAHVPSH